MREREKDREREGERRREGMVEREGGRERRGGGILHGYPKFPGERISASTWQPQSFFAAETEKKEAALSCYVISPDGRGIVPSSLSPGF